LWSEGYKKQKFERIKRLTIMRKGRIKLDREGIRGLLNNSINGTGLLVGCENLTGFNEIFLSLDGRGLR